MLLAVDLYKYLIDIEGIAVASVLAFQSTCINRSEFDTPEADRLAGYTNASLSEQIFKLAVAQVDALVEPRRRRK